METKKFDSIDAIFSFILAGVAYFTICNTKTNNRFTYRVVKKESHKEGEFVWFVSVLTGSNNESDYTYLGTIFNDGRYFHGLKSRISVEAMSAQAFRWLYNRLETHTDLGSVEFWHEGRCGRCGRKLTTPESIEIGYGPTCADLMRSPWIDVAVA
jgi:hypothetical protein